MRSSYRLTIGVVIPRSISACGHTTNLPPQNKELAGADPEGAVVPAKARAVLAHFDDRSAHYDAVVAPPPDTTVSGAMA